MKHRLGISRSQVLLFPDSVEDYVAAEHPVRFLDAFVGSLDLHALGFKKARAADTGRPPYDPADLLRLFLYGYLHRVRSSRALERECQRNVEVLWLLRKLAPDHKTIADFRRDHVRPLQAVHRQFRLLCHKLGLFGRELVAIDGSKFAAVNARDRNYNEARLRELIAHADARLAGYLRELETADAAEEGEAVLTRAQLEEKIAALRDKQEWHEELLSQLDDEQKQISTTDPDARRMPTAQGSVVAYNAQSAVDAQHKLIVADDVTNEVNDYGQLASLAIEARENLGAEELTVVADQGYYNNAEVRACVDRQITPFIAKADTSANRALGLYSKKDFAYDAARDVYHCPAGAQLTYRFSTQELGRELRYYRARDCARCPLKSQCTRNKGNRTITRESDEHLMEAMAERVQRDPDKLRQRKALVEHPFGTIKRWFGYTHFLLKGLAKVRGEWSLITLVYNLKRVLNLVSFEKLMAAVAVEN
jgi:transposase